MRYRPFGLTGQAVSCLTLSLGARDIAGAPLRGARILNAPVPGTGANGGFVADFPRRERTLYLLQDDRLLQCPLQVRERRNVVMLVGQVECAPLNVAQLPADIRQQARVTRLLQEAVQHQAPQGSGAVRPKLRYAHQGGMNPPIVVIHGSGLDHIGDAYRRYLEGRVREHFKLSGTPLRIEFRSSRNPFDENKV